MTKKNQRTVARRAAIALLLAAGCANAWSQSIALIVGGIEKQIYLPAALAERLGYFRDEGLDVHVRSESSGVNAEDELLTGSVQGVVGFYDHTIDLQAKGKFVQAVVQFSRAPGEALVAATDKGGAVHALADLKGRSIGVTGLGSSTHLLVRYLAATAGVKSGDMAISAVGSGARFDAALRAGHIDAGMTTEPTASWLLRNGDARLLVDLRTPDATAAALGGPYPGACLYMASRWVETHRADVQKLVNAMVRALRFIDTHSAQEIAQQLPPAYLAGNPALYVGALQDTKSMFVADGAMPAGGPENVLRVMRTADRDMARKPIDLSRTFTTDFTRAARP